MTPALAELLEISRNRSRASRRHSHTSDRLRMGCAASVGTAWTGIARFVMAGGALLLTFPADAQQNTDYRVIELTQACYHRTRVPASVERAKRGVGEFKFGCAPAEQGHEVRLIKRKGEEALVYYCITDRCDRRWILSSKLAKIDR